MVIGLGELSERKDTDMLTDTRYNRYNSKAEVSALIAHALNQRCIYVEPIMELDTLDTCQLMVIHGLGVGILPLSPIRKRFRKPLL